MPTGGIGATRAQASKHAGIATANSETRPSGSARTRGISRRPLASASLHRAPSCASPSRRSGSHNGGFTCREAARDTARIECEQVPGRHRTPAGPHRSVTVAALNLDGAAPIRDGEADSPTCSCEIASCDLPRISRECNLGTSQQHALPLRLWPHVSHRHHGAGPVRPGFDALIEEAAAGSIH